MSPLKRSNVDETGGWTQGCTVRSWPRTLRVLTPELPRFIQADHAVLCPQLWSTIVLWAALTVPSAWAVRTWVTSVFGMMAVA